MVRLRDTITAKYGTVHSANRNSKLKCTPYFFNHAGSVQHSRNDPWYILGCYTNSKVSKMAKCKNKKCTFQMSCQMSQKITGNPYNKQWGHLADSFFSNHMFIINSIVSLIMCTWNVVYLKPDYLSIFSFFNTVLWSLIVYIIPNHKNEKEK